MEPGSVLHRGYLVPGEEIIIKGGTTLHFQKKSRRYFVLQTVGGSSLMLYGYKDEKAMKRSSETNPTSGRQRKTSVSQCTTIHLMTSLLVHKVVMKTKKKAENVLIVVSGSHPNYFRPDNQDDMEKWYAVFMNFATNKKVKPRKPRKMIDLRTNSSDSIHSSDSTLDSRPASRPEPYRDSGVSASSRCSQGSDRSSTSSDEICEYSPCDLPSTIFFDPGEEDLAMLGSDSPVSSPRSSEGAGFGSRNWRKSIFIKNTHGEYEERQVRESGMSHESGFGDSSSRQNSCAVDSDEENDEGSRVKSEPPYDTLPFQKSMNMASSDKAPSEATPSIPVKINPKSQTQPARDSPDGSPLSPLIENFAINAGITDRAELEKILNDDGTTHTYINLKKPGGQRNSFILEADSDISADTPPALPLRKSSLPTITTPPSSDTRVKGALHRRETCPAMHPTRQSPLLNHYDTFPSRPTNLFCFTDNLIREQALAKPIAVVLEKSIVNDALALVEIHGKVWIAGWRSSLHKEIYGNFHVGDQLVQVNDQMITQAAWANTCISTSCKETITLHVRRLPHGKIVNCKRISNETPWGVDVKGNEIIQVHNGPVLESGLPRKAEAVSSKKQCEWTITEIANQPVRFGCAKDEIKYIFNNCSLELPLVVHPKDFMQDLSKALSKLKHASHFIAR
ncbi:uncharacterized protein [Diadema antillarum]|uniref:uncharacterized protein isoform X1 n=1 Tax=Diadema antillarum TaxID=105358 RepID=UPI003A83A7A8